MSEYLLLDDALQVVARYGFHIRDVGLLASAVARPLNEAARRVSAHLVSPA